MKKCFSIWIATGVLWLVSSLAGGMLRAATADSPYKVCKLIDPNPGLASYQALPLQPSTIYYVDRDMDIGCDENPRGLEVLDTAIIHINRNCTLRVHGYREHAAIHVPVGKVLILSGDEGSVLWVSGGRSMSGKRGENGKNGVPNVFNFKKPNQGGRGGKGGDGGNGGGAAIGGNGGQGGVGGNGAPYNDCQHNSNQRSGSDGSSAFRGQDGESMGVVYVVGDVRIEAIGASAPAPELDRANAGDNKSAGGTIIAPFVYCSGGGGGGTGSQGGAGSPIGGGGYGGGGGGGGGSGAVINSNRFKGNKHYYAKGQGGRGGGAGADILNGLPDESGLRCGYKGGSGGSGARSGEMGDMGSLFARDQEAAFIYPEKLKRSVNPILPSMKVMRTWVNYADVDLSVYRPYRFYYGMPMSDSINVPYSMTDDVFGGFYSDNTKVYDENGYITPEGRRLLYTYDNITLRALWLGPARVHLELMYEIANPDLIGLDTIVYTYDTAYLSMRMGESEHITFRASDFCSEGYQIKTDLRIDTMLHRGDLITGVARYKLVECTMNWLIDYNEKEVSHHVTFRDWYGNPLTTQTYPRYWQVLTPPELVYDSDIWRLRTRIVKWDGMPYVMDQKMMGAYLRLDWQWHSIFLNMTSDAGGSAEVFAQDSVHPTDSCYYAQPMRIELHPKPGYRALTPEVNQWIGDSVGASIVITQENDTLYTLLGDSTDIVVKPRFEREDYHIYIDYTAIGQAPSDPTACTYVTTSADDYLTIVPVEEAVIHNDEYVSMVSWYCQDEVYDWIGVPTVVNRLTGDTIEAQLSVETIVSDDDAYYLCYTFRAPASDVDVHMKMYYRPQHDCRIFDDKQDETIDSVMVDLNTVVLPKDSTIRIRPMDILTLCVSADTSAVRAGYWDEEGAFHRMSVRADAELSPSGEYNMYYYSVIAPDAPMTMGVVNGLRIHVEHCDSMVRWVAPSGALEGDTVSYTIEASDPCYIVKVDSVCIYDLNSQLIYRAVGDACHHGQFVMPAQHVFVHVYARKVGDRVPYLDVDGEICYVDNPTPIVSHTEGHIALDEGWYVVRDADVRIAGAEFYGDVRIILADGASLTSIVDRENAAGITLSRDYPLTIYGQSAQTGRLTAYGAEMYAGIGVNADDANLNLTINGGIITAIGGNLAAGIGGRVRRTGSHITVNRGIVTAISGDMETSGIGSGHCGSPSTDIYVADSLFVRAGQNAATEKIEHTITTDIASALHGQRYVTIRPAYHRSTKSGTYGTICLPYGSTDLTGAGAVFYKVSGANRTEDGTLRSIALDTVTTLVGGYSYVFRATENQLRIECVGEEVSEPVSANGMIGKLSAEPERFWGGENIYILGTDNKIHHVADTVSINFVQNRAYFDLTDVPPTSTDPTPGRLVMGVVGGDSGITTYLEETPLSQPDQARKMFIQGRIVILRGNRFYTLDGREL